MDYVFCADKYLITHGDDNEVRKMDEYLNCFQSSYDEYLLK
jgi:hypothetical protein